MVFDAANKAEFHEFNFGHDVVGESEKLLKQLVTQGAGTGSIQ